MNAFADIDYVNWDLMPFFGGFKTPEYENFHRRLVSELARLKDLIRGLNKLSKKTAPSWRNVFLIFEEICMDVEHLQVYLKCLSAVDSHNTQLDAELVRVDRVIAEQTKILATIKWQLKTTPERELQSLLSTAEMESAAFYIKRLFVDSCHSLAPEQEELIAELNTSGLIAWGRAYEGLIAGTYIELNDRKGSKTQQPFSLLRTLLSDPNTQIRDAASRGAGKACAAAAPVAASCLNGIIGTRLTLNRHRSFQDPLDKACLDADVSRDTVDTMFKVIWSRRDVCKNYLQLKADVLADGNILYRDLRAPLLKESKRLSLDKARSIIEASYRNAFPELADHARHVFELAWIDTAPDEHKAPGGFCVASPRIKESRILMTYAGSLADLCILAHELGHSYHAQLLQQQRYFLQKVPLTLLETAAMFSEGLMRWSMLERADVDEESRLSYLSTDLNTAATFLLEIPTHFEFEVSAYKERVTRELTSPVLNELMGEAQEKWLADIFDKSSLNECAWVGVPQHFVTYTSFYNFPYCFAYLLAEIMLACFEEQGSTFILDFKKLMSLSATRHVENILRDILGIDLREEKVWEQAFQRIDTRVQRLHALYVRNQGN